MAEQPKTFKSEHDRQSLVNVRKRFLCLQDLINQLPRQVSNVASNAENEFLAAYRVHMLSIQAELKDLNEQVAKAEEQLNDDGHVAKLEHEVSWFRVESSRLKTNTESMYKDLQGMYAKLHALQEQKMFLNDQLKSVMKRSRVLEAELESNLLRQNQMKESNNILNQYNPNVDSSLAGYSIIKSNLSNSKSNTLKKIKTLSPNMITSSSDNNFKSSFRKINDKLLVTKSNSENFKSLSYSVSLKKLITSRHQTEIDLESAIKESFNNIVSRRIAIAAQNVCSFRHDFSKNNNTSSEQPNNDFRGPIGITGLGIEHFSETDRLDAMTTFLAQQTNFEQIVNILSDQILV